MKKNLVEWKILNTYTLAQATLLMLGHNPGDWSQSKLIENPPLKFDLIFGKMIEDAKFHLGYRESEEVEGKYFAEYKLMTDNPEDIDTRPRKDFFTTTSDRLSINRWTKSLVTYLSMNQQTIDGVDLNYFNGEILHEPVSYVEIEEEKLSPRKENNLLKIINGLSLRLEGYDRKHPYTAADIIIKESAVNIKRDTVANYIMKLNEILEKESMKS